MSSSAPVQEAAMSAHGATKRRHSSHGTSGDEEDEDRSTVEDAVDNKRRRLSTGSSEGAGADVGSGNGSGSASNGNVGGPMAPAAPAPASSTSSADGVESSVRKVTPVASWHKYRYGAGAESEGRSGIPPLTSTGRPGEEEDGAYDSDATGTVGGVRLQQPRSGSVKSHDSDVEVEEESDEGESDGSSGGQVAPAGAGGGDTGTGAGTGGTWGGGGPRGPGGFHAGKRSRSHLMLEEAEEDGQDGADGEDAGDDEQEEEEWMPGRALAGPVPWGRPTVPAGPTTASTATGGRPRAHKLPSMPAYAEMQLLRAIKQYHPAFHSSRPAHYRGTAFTDALQRACGEGVACGDYPAWAAYWAACCAAQGGSGVLGPLRQKLAHNLYCRASHRKRTGQLMSLSESQPLQSGGSGRVVDRDTAQVGDVGEGVTAGSSAATQAAGERAAPRGLALGPAAHADLLHGRYHEAKSSSRYYVLDISPATTAGTHPAPPPPLAFIAYITFSAQARGRPTREIADMKGHILQQLAPVAVISMADMERMRGLAAIVGLDMEYVQLSTPVSYAHITGTQQVKQPAAPAPRASSGTAAVVHVSRLGEHEQPLMAHANQALLLANSAIAAPASAVYAATVQGEARFYTKESSSSLVGRGYFLLQELPPVGSSANPDGRSSASASQAKDAGGPGSNLITGSDAPEPVALAVHPAAGFWGTGSAAPEPVALAVHPAAGFHVPARPHPACSSASSSSSSAAPPPTTGAGAGEASGEEAQEEAPAPQPPLLPPVASTSAPVGTTSTSFTAIALHKLVQANVLHALALGQGVTALAQLCIGSRWLIRWVPETVTSSLGPPPPPSAGTVSWQQQVQVLDQQLSTLGTKTMPWTPAEIAAMQALGDVTAICQAPLAVADAQRALLQHVPLLASLFSSRSEAGQLVGMEVLHVRRLMCVQHLMQRAAATADPLAASNLSTLSTSYHAQGAQKRATLVELASLALQWKALLASPKLSPVGAQLRSDAGLLQLCLHTAERHRHIQAEMAKVGGKMYQGHAGDNFSVLAPAVLQQLRAAASAAAGRSGTAAPGIAHL